MAGLAQPIIRGIQAVGNVMVQYQYNASDYNLPVPSGMILLDESGNKVNSIATKGGIYLAGFRLDGQYLDAKQQVPTSNTIPLLGGGGISLTNNNRTGTLTLTCSHFSSVSADGAMSKGSTSSNMGVVYDDENANVNYYDIVYVAQIQQAQTGGDSAGATIAIAYKFNDQWTIVQFEGCTVADISPLQLSGNDAAQYAITWNYLNWKMTTGSETASIY